MIKKILLIVWMKYLVCVSAERKGGGLFWRGEWCKICEDLNFSALQAMYYLHNLASPWKGIWGPPMCFSFPTLLITDILCLCFAFPTLMTWQSKTARPMAIGNNERSGIFKLRGKHSALKRQHLALENMKFLYCFLFCGSFCPPESGSGSSNSN
jgi:hypothetical protein